MFNIHAEIIVEESNMKRRWMILVGLLVFAAAAFSFDGAKADCKNGCCPACCTANCCK